MKKTARIIINVLIGIGVVVGIYFLVRSFKKESVKVVPNTNKPIAIEGYIVKSSVLADNIQVVGTLLPAEEVTIQSEISGRIVSLSLQEGKMVQKGSLLVKIFDEDLQAQLKKLNTQLATVENTFKRQAELLKIKGISQQEYDQTLLQVNGLKADVELIEIQIKKTEIKAPFTGILGLRQVSEGTYLVPAQKIVSLRATQTLKLDFSVPEKYGSFIQIGKRINFTVEGQSKTFTAQVTATEQNIENTTRSLQVRALVLEQHPDLISGKFASVSMTLAERPQALLVPTQAIIPQAKSKIVVVSRGGIATFQPVKTGIRQAALIEITEGLKTGDTIVTTGILFVKPKTKLLFSNLQ